MVRLPLRPGSRSESSDSPLIPLPATTSWRGQTSFKGLPPLPGGGVGQIEAPRDLYFPTVICTGTSPQIPSNFFWPYFGSLGNPPPPRLGGGLKGSLRVAMLQRHPPATPLERGPHYEQIDRFLGV